MHSFKKLAGLFVLYAIIIVGIFVIQFSSDSVIRKNIGGIRVTLAQTESDNGTISLKNNFQVSYGALLFIGDENTPVKYYQDGTTHSAKLLSFEERGNSACALNFENQIQIVFSVNDENEQQTFSVKAELPEGVESIDLNFTPTASYSINEKKVKSVIFANKKNAEEFYSLTAPAITESVLTLQPNFNSAYYALFVEEEGYTLDDIESLALASKDVYEATIKSVSTALVNQFMNAVESDASFASSLNEQTAISFLAEMAHIGRYNEGVNTVPTQFINSTRRTYLSTPFFGGLAATLSTLTMQTRNFNNMISRAVQEKTLDIFTVQNIAQYMYTQGNRGNIARLLAMPATLTELNLNTERAAGIIRSYMYFKSQGSSMATPLEPILELCAQKIVDSCTLEGEKIVIKEDELPVSTYAAICAGDALIQYGIQFEQSRVESFGYCIVNSYAGETDTLDLRTLGELYPILIHDNKYYPHFELLKTVDSGNVWVYTIAPYIGYGRNAELTITFDIDFPIGLSHYMYVFGIPAFQRIQIYNMDFRTDARFETYNSSGYVYIIENNALLLKSRHRDRHEIVRLYYRNNREPAENNTENEAEAVENTENPAPAAE